ncbi:MAG: DUF86 domain-containing protein [Bacillota bacterium]
MSRDPAILLDIAAAARRVMHFVHNVDQSTFLADEQKCWAVYSQIIIIGEAVRRLSPEFQAANPQIPWPLIVGMRNRLIHAYDQVNWQRVWQTVAQDIPTLLTSIEPLLPSPDTP